jgi:pimeloyl-ACP methyl ester carboxylesterase
VELTADMEQMFAAGFRCIQIEGCGHFLQLEDPERVSREILAFLCAD